MTAHELFGFAARTAARDRDAERAVGAHAKDVASRPAHSDELDHGMRLRRTSRVLSDRVLRPEEWKIELHLARW
jgi:hypothetical protein